MFGVNLLNFQRWVQGLFIMLKNIGYIDNRFIIINWKSLVGKKDKLQLCILYFDVEQKVILGGVVWIIEFILQGEFKF